MTHGFPWVWGLTLNPTLNSHTLISSPTTNIYRQVNNIMFGNDKCYEEKDKEEDEGNSEWVVTESYFEEITSELAMYGTSPSYRAS